MKDANEGLSFAPWAPLQGLLDLCMIDIRSRCTERDLFHITENKSWIFTLYVCFASIQCSVRSFSGDSMPCQ